MNALYYAALLALLIIVPVVSTSSRIRRSRTMRQASAELDQIGSSATYRDLSYPELGFLLGGPKRALVTGMAEAASGRVGPPNSLSGFLAPRLDDSTASVEQLRTEAEPLLRQITDRLEHLRLIMSGQVAAAHDGHCRIARLIGWTVYLVFVAVTFWQIGIDGDSIYILVFSIILGAAWTGMWTPSSKPEKRPTAAAQRITDAVKDDFAYLDPENKPAYSSYGPWAPVVGAAVFGPPAFLLAFPHLADNPLAQELMAAGASTTNSGSGCSTSSCGTDSDGCSTSGCSSSCSSSSSCGGGCGGGD